MKYNEKPRDNWKTILKLLLNRKSAKNYVDRILVRQTCPLLVIERLVSPPLPYKNHERSFLVRSYIFVQFQLKLYFCLRGLIP